MFVYSSHAVTPAPALFVMIIQWCVFVCVLVTQSSQHTDSEWSRLSKNAQQSHRCCEQDDHQDERTGCGEWKSMKV